MLEDQDIDKLTKAFTNVFATKQEINNSHEKMQEQFSDLIISVDSYSKKADAYYQEMMMHSQKMDRHEKWLQQIAAKLDLKLEY